MEIIKTAIEGVVIIEPRLFKDDRGYFFESFSQREFAEKVRKSVHIPGFLRFIAAAEARETVKTEVLNQVESQAPATETRAEEVKTEAAEAAAPAAGEPAPAAHDISEGLEENLAKAGLTQVQTDASLAEPYSYTCLLYTSPSPRDRG